MHVNIIVLFAVVAAFLFSRKAEGMMVFDPNPPMITPKPYINLKGGSKKKKGGKKKRKNQNKIPSTWGLYSPMFPLSQFDGGFVGKHNNNKIRRKKGGIKKK